jgi:hypothetical protein
LTAFLASLPASLVVGVISGFVASLFFFLWQRLFRPRISISPKIALASDGRNGAVVPRIKLINRARRDAYAVNVDVVFQWSRTGKAARGRTKQSDRLKVQKKYGTTRVYDSIMRRKFFDDEFDHCRRIRINNPGDGGLQEAWMNLQKEVNSDVTLVVKVTAEDSWSRVRKTFYQEYVSFTSGIQHGSFVVGASFDIEPM